MTNSAERDADAQSIAHTCMSFKNWRCRRWRNIQRQTYKGLQQTSDLVRKIQETASLEYAVRVKSLCTLALLSCLHLMYSHCRCPWVHKMLCMHAELELHSTCTRLLSSFSQFTYSTLLYMYTPAHHNYIKHIDSRDIDITKLFNSVKCFKYVKGWW